MFGRTVSRHCDQYSLAIVYQELLTGTVPFDGSNTRQLLVQHTKEEPNLKPLPPDIVAPKSCPPPPPLPWPPC